jgi:type III secretion protein J
MSKLAWVGATASWPIRHSGQLRAGMAFPTGWRKLASTLGLLVLAFLAGCQVDLHTKATEVDANEMLGALLSAGLDARKATPDAGKTWTISVEELQMARAIEVLRDNALPRERRATLGDLFKKEGLISSPTEERVRFLFGVQQGLAETLSKIDGVIVARVHIVLPNNDPLATTVKPSSAAVFVKHRRSVEIQALIPAIKTLVVHSVEGLQYHQVTVTPVAAELPVPSAAGVGAADAKANGRFASSVWLIGALALLLVLGTAAGAVWWLKRKGLMGRARPTAQPAATGDQLVAIHAAGT